MIKLLPTVAKLATCLLLSTSAFAQLNLNLEAHYDFSGNTNDISGNNQNATNVGAALTNDRFGTANSAYSFDGVDDYIDLNEDFDFQERTINLWVSATSITTTVGAIFDVDHPGQAFGHNKMFVEESGGQDLVTIGTSSTSYNQAISTGTWYMLTITRDATTTRFYIDGALTSTQSTATLSSVSGHNEALLGCTRIFDRFFNGKIDDVRIYSRALSQCEVRELFGVTASVTATTNLSTVCAGDTVTLSASGTISYLWDNGAGSGATVTVTPTVSTDYVVTGTDALGCTATDTVSITVNALPTVVATGPSTVCAGDPVTLTATGATNFMWDNGLGAGNTVSDVPTTNTTYTVTGTDGNGCSNTDQVMVNVFALPNVIVTGDSILCAGSSTTLLAGGAATYVWDGGAATGPSYTITPTNNSTVSVQGTDANGCSNTAQLNVTVNALPDTSVTATATTLTANASGVTYQWLDCNNNFDVYVGETGQVISNISGSFAVEVTNANGCVDTSSCYLLGADGIFEAAASAQLKAFPNPAQEILNLDLSNLQGATVITVYNTLGQEVHRAQVTAGTIASLNLSALRPGSYLVQAQNNSKLLTTFVIRN